jgi:hypothetical protein
VLSNGFQQTFPQGDGLATHREMSAIGGDPARVRSLALGLLKLAETAENVFSEWELTFLRSMAEQAEGTLGLSRKQRKEMKDSNIPAEARLAFRDFRLTTRQAEKLLDIRDGAVLCRDIRRVSVRNLINRCHEGRVELDEDDELFIEQLWQSGVAELRRNDLARLKRCSVQLGWLEDYM